MTLKNRYERIMDNVEVTNDMHERIMKNIKEVGRIETKRNIIAVRNYTKYLSMAACFVVLFVGMFFIRSVVNNRQGNLQQVVPDIMEYSSNKELSDAIGFKVCEIKKLPMEIAEVKYIAYWGEIAQIEYINPNNTLTLRMAISDDDISGDYYNYSIIKNIFEDNNTVTIKGDGEKYTLAVWQSEGYSYSLKISNGVSESEMLKLVGSVQ